VRRETGVTDSVGATAREAAALAVRSRSKNGNEAREPSQRIAAHHPSGREVRKIPVYREPATHRRGRRKPGMAGAMGRKWQNLPRRRRAKEAASMNDRRMASTPADRYRRGPRIGSSTEFHEFPASPTANGKCPRRRSAYETYGDCIARPQQCGACISTGLIAGSHHQAGHNPANGKSAGRVERADRAGERRSTRQASLSGRLRYHAGHTS